MGSGIKPESLDCQSSDINDASIYGDDFPNVSPQYLIVHDIQYIYIPFDWSMTVFDTVDTQFVESDKVIKL